MPGAVDYYRALARRGRVAYSVLPYNRPQDPGEFNFDWSSNFCRAISIVPGPRSSSTASSVVDAPQYGRWV